MTTSEVRLLRGARGSPRTLREHEELFGVAPTRADLLRQLELSGLQGRGGAAFPTYAKAALIRNVRSHHKYVVVNAMEGEPASHKDQLLLGTNPHLVLDGAEALAHALDARDIAVCVPREKVTTVQHVRRALHERHPRGVRVELHTPPGRYIAGEESALVHWLDDNETLPQFRATRPTVLRIGRGPVLVVNTETHANVGLIARYGAQWFRSLGPTNHPGTTLVSVSGAVRRPVVVEVPLGAPLRSILSWAQADPAPRALLLGGYGGSWLDGAHLDATYDNPSLARWGASVGAGVIAVLPADSCGVAETSRVARWMANESARQCGPCAFGLPTMADDLADLALGARDPAAALARLEHHMATINGRGACRHPDGVVRMVASTLSVFRDDVRHHAAGRPCAAAGHSHYATVPRLERESEMVWQ